MTAPAPPIPGHAVGTVLLIGWLYVRVSVGAADILVRRKYLPGVKAGDTVAIGPAIPRDLALLPWSHVSD